MILDSTLNDQERLVLDRRIDGLTYAQIGPLLGRSRQRVCQILHRAQRKVIFLEARRSRAQLAGAALDDATRYWPHVARWNGLDP